MRPFSGQAWFHPVPCVSRKARSVSPKAPTLSHKARTPPLKGACTAQADATRVVKSEDARAFCDRLAAWRGERAPLRGVAGAFSGKRGGSELVERAEHATAAAVHDVGVDLRAGQFGARVMWVPLDLVQNETETPGPIDMYLLGADGAVQHAETCAERAQLPRQRRRGRGGFNQGGAHG